MIIKHFFLKRFEPAILLLIVLFLFSKIGYSQEISVIGNSYSIADNDTTPNTADFTDFGTATSRMFYVGNSQQTGNTFLNISNIVLSDNINFEISTSGPLPINGIPKSYYANFTIKLKGTSCGTFTSTVTISSNATNDGADNVWTFTIRAFSSPEINVLGGGISIVDGDTTPITTDNTDFGSTYVGTPVIKTFTIQNTGNCTLTNGAFSFSGTNAAEFTLVTAPALSLASGASTTFQVSFTPAAAGTRTAVISFANNDANENPYNFSIQGTGVVPITVGPGGVTADLKLWLRADLLDGTTSVTDNTNVTTWQTQSGAVNATALSGNEPVFKNNSSDNINFNAVVNFNNVSTSYQFMKGTSGFYSNEMFVVVMPNVTINALTTRNSIFSGKAPSSSPTADITGVAFGEHTTRITNEVLSYTLNDASKYGIGDVTTSYNYNNAGIINARHNTNSSATGMQLLYNASTVGNIEANTSTFLNVSNSEYFLGTNIGTNISPNLNGRIAEIITFSSRKDDVTDRPKIETYLAIKYGITLGVNGTSKTYVNSDNIPIWNITTNAGYNHDIAGIGRDDASKLNQKQSKSVNASSYATIGLGTIAATNTANLNIFDVDKSYLVWGHNNLPITDAGSNFSKAIGASVQTSSRMLNRKWKIVETTGDVAEVIVSIPTTLLSVFSKTLNDEYVLIVSSTAAFLDADIIDVIPLKSAGSNLQTWYDFDGTRFFTFGITPKTESKYQSNIVAGDYFVGENNINLNSTFTISSWVKNSNSGTVRTFVSKGSDYELVLNIDNLIEVSWNGVSRIISNTPIADAKWHHIAVTYTGGITLLYIDGILDKTETSLPIPMSSSAKFSIGATYNSKNAINNVFLGDIDEVRIWDTALTEVQLHYLMNQEMEKFADSNVNGKTIPQMITLNDVKTIPWTNVKAYYDLNTYYGTTSEDKSNNRNFLRVKYLNATKSVVNTQTAPLPYTTKTGGTGNWEDAVTWTNGDVQNLPNTTITRNGISNEITWNIVETSHNISSMGNKTLLGLIVNGTSTITAGNDTKMEVSHYLKLNGVIDLQGKSQLVQTLNSDLEPTSAGYIKRNQQGVGNKNSYNYWSSPVGPINATTNNNSHTVKGVFKQGLANDFINTTNQDITWIGGYDGNNTTNPISLARYWLWKFANGTVYSNWAKIDENSALLPSQGFTAKGAGAVGSGTQNYTFVGKPNNGNIALNSVLADNYFLVGNPYPSALDGLKFIAENAATITGTIYFWEQSSGNNTHYLAGYTGGYSTLSGTGGVGPIAPVGISGLGQGSYKVPKQFIPVGQGFYVMGKTGMSGAQPIVFNNGQRGFQKEDSPESTTLFKNGATAKRKTQLDHFIDNSSDPIIDEKLIKIRLGFNTTDKFHRQLLLGFMNEKATDGEDYGYDAKQIDTRANDMFFPINKAKFITQGVGYFDANKIYPLGIGVTIGGNVQFVLDEVLNLPSDVSICVFDKLTGESHNISQKSFEIDLAPGTYLDRFALTFKMQKLVAEDVTAQILIPATAQPIIEGIHVFMNNTIGELQIKNNSTEEIVSVALINALGQTLKIWNSNFNIRTISLPLSTATGVYLVQINTKTGKTVKKISVE